MRKVIIILLLLSNIAIAKPKLEEYCIVYFDRMAKHYTFKESGDAEMAQLLLYQLDFIKEDAEKSDYKDVVNKCTDLSNKIYKDMIRSNITLR